MISRLFKPVIALFMIAFLGGTVAYAEQAPESLNQLIPKLKAWGTDAVLVSAVKAQNREGLTLAEIKKRDAKWQSTSDVDDFMKTLMANDAAKKMLEFEKSMPFLVELFLMDNQGANVAMTNKTSDYWQGDEAKFIESFNSGNGKVFIGDVEYDDSVLAYLVQVSVPILDNGKTIGVMTIGVNLDDYENQ
jgi:hypothetical protein